MERDMNCCQARRAIALSCLEEICSNAEAKHSDRIAAAKLLLEQSGESGEQGLRVVMEAIPKEYLT